MGMIPAKCTNCGANIQVDETKEAGICEACGTAFITEKAVNNYNISNTYNIETANITVKSVDIDARISAAEKLVSSGFLSDGQTMLYELIKEFPEDYRPYYLLAKNAYEYRDVPLEGDEYFEKAKALADAEGLEIITQYYKKAHVDVYGGNLEITAFCEKGDISKLNYCYLKWYYSESLNSSEGYGYWGFEPINGVPTIVMYTKNPKYNYVRHVLDQNNLNCRLSTSEYKKRLICVVVHDNGFAWLPQHVKNEISLKCDTVGYDTTCRLYITEIKDGKAVYNNAPEDMVYGDVFRSQSTDFEKTSGQCYIATCVYGFYDCPQVWTLRRFRDNTLGTTWYGRLFIRVYYAISPTLVKWFGETRWFKKMWQGRLDKMVLKLQSKGVKDTPYQDKEW